MRPVSFQRIAAFALAAASVLNAPAFAQQPPQLPQASQPPAQSQVAQPPPSAQPDDISSLAIQLADAIKKSHPASTTIAVMNFQGPQAGAAPFGVYLADEFSAALAKALPYSHIIDRDAVKTALVPISLTSSYQASPDAPSPDAQFAQVALNVHAEIFVSGTFGAMGNGIGVTLGASEAKDTHKSIATSRGLLALRPEITNHINVSPDLLRPFDGIFNAGSAGIGDVKCLRCSSPSFTSEAAKRKINGIVYLDIVVGIDGTISNERLRKSIGDPGLDEHAMELVRTWKLSPAHGADGLLRPVRVNVEVAFKTK